MKTPILQDDFSVGSSLLPGVEWKSQEVRYSLKTVLFKGMVFILRQGLTGWPGPQREPVSGAKSLRVWPLLPPTTRIGLVLLRKKKRNSVRT